MKCFYNHKYSNSEYNPNSWLTGIFCLRQPENSSKLVFSNPITDNSKINFYNKYYIDIQELSCFIFPSYLNVYEESFTYNEKDKIIINFNIGEK